MECALIKRYYVMFNQHINIYYVDRYDLTIRLNVLNDTFLMITYKWMYRRVVCLLFYICFCQVV